jgi:hypothetical protein
VSDSPCSIAEVSKRGTITLEEQVQDEVEIKIAYKILIWREPAKEQRDLYVDVRILT